MNLLTLLFRHSARRFAAPAPFVQTGSRRRSRQTDFQPERLEPRLALSASQATGAASFSRVSADWFADMPAATLPAVVLTSAGGPGVAAVDMATATSPLAPALAAASIAKPTGSEWIVRMSPEAVTGFSRVTDVAATLRSAPLGLEVVRGLGLPGQVLVRATGTEAAVREYLGSRSDISSFGTNASISLSATPNDPLFSQLYGLHNTGQTGGLVDADIDAPEAWDISTGSRSVVVGVVDTGIAWNHPDLAANMWRNPGEVAGNGIDDDANGFVDDVYGYDFVNNDGDPMDDNSHGTHCAGTIGGVGNNGTGVAGVAWEVSLMGLKFLSAGGSGSTANAIRALNYATMMRSRGVNVQVTSNSWGGGGFDAGLRDAINAGGAAGILFVAAAGNNGANADVSPSYPAAYDSPFIVSVAATDHADGLASFSNYGATSVDIGAPGVNIRSTVPGNSYASYSGTSMATPHVAGAAALALAVDPTLSPVDLKARLMSTADPLPSLAGKTVTGGRLNVNTLVRSLGLSVVSSSPARGTNVSTVPADYVITFSQAFLPASVDATDFTVNGQSATDFTLLSDRSVRFTFATSPVVAEGLQTMAIAAGALTGAGDLSPSQPFTGTFRYDTVPLQVTSTLPAAGGVLVVPGVIDVLFSEPLDPASVQASDLVLSGLPAAVVQSATLLPGNTGIRFTVGPLATEGSLTATLAAGAVTDIHGNPGSGFTAGFTVDFGGDTPLAAPVRQQPDAARVAEAAAGGLIGVAGDSDGFTIVLDANQLLSVVVTPAAGLRPAVAVFGPDGTSLAASEAPAAGSVASVHTVPAAAAGTYRIVVSAADATTGGYTARVRLNGALEAESLGGPANDSLATAQSLDAAFRTETTSLASGAIAVVTGQSDGGFQPTAVPYAFEDIASTGTVIAALTGQDDMSVSIPIGFAFPFFGESHTSVFVSTNGLLTFGSGNNAYFNTDFTTSPAQAAIAPLWDDFIVPTSGKVLSAVTGTGADQRLTIQWHNVVFYSVGGTDTLSFQAQLYADGRIRFNYLDLSGGSVGSDGGRSATVGVKAAGSQEGQRTLVSFNAAPGALVGSLRSTVLASPAAAHDLYAFSLGAGEAVSLAVRGATAGLQLLDATGTVVATGASVTGAIDQAISGFSPAVGGSYFARITGPAAPYSLVVCRGAGFDLATNTAPSTARPLAATGAVFGAVGTADWYAITAPADGSPLRFETSTPDERLDPRLDLYDASGTTLLASGMSLGDGRNESLVTSGTVAGGGYLLRVSGQGTTAGDYLLGFANGIADPDGPTDIALSAATVEENQPADSVVGQLTTSDPESGDTFTYTLVAGAGSVDNALFAIVGDALVTAAELDFEARPSYSVRIRSTDSDGSWTEKPFTITVTNVNETPTDVALSATSIAENAGANAVIGTLTTTDPDAGNTFTSTLAAGTGDTDNAVFTIVGSQLRANASFDFETRSSFSIRVRSTDQGGLSIEKTFTITVTNVNEAPTDVTLSATSIAENAGANAVVGTLTTTDPDASNSFTYALITGTGSADNAAFNISGNTLRATASFNFETKNSYSVRIRSTDQGGLFTEKTFTITVTNVNEAPPVVAGVVATVAYVENSVPTVTAPAGVVTDPDLSLVAGGTLTVTILANGEAADRLAIRNQGTAAGQVGVSGTTLTVGGVAVATVAGGTAGDDPLVVTFTSAVTPAVAQTILRNVTFANVSDAPGTLPRKLAYQVADGAGLASAVVQQTVTVRAVNDASVVGGITGPLTYVENATLLTAPDATVFDIDSPDFATGRLTVRVATNASAADRLTILNQGTGADEVGVSGTTVRFGGVAVGTFSPGSGGSPLTVTFNAAATSAIVQAVTRRVGFSIASDAPSILPRTLTYSLTDGDGGTSATVSQVVNVVAENDAPVLAGVAATAAYVENAIPTVTAPAGVVTDPDLSLVAGGTLTVTILANGEAADRLAIRNRGTAAGQVGVSGTTLTVGGVAVATVAGGTAGDDPLVVTFTSAVTPAVAQTILRNVTFANVSDAPGTLPRKLAYQVADGAGLASAVVQQTVTVRAVNDASVVGGISGGIISGGTGSLLLAPAATVADVDSAGFGGGSLRVSIAAGGLASDRLAILGQGADPGQISVSGGTVFYGGVAIGTVTGGTGLTALAIVFNGNATAEAAQALLRSISYASVAADPTNGGRNATRTIRYALADAPTAAGGLTTAVQQSLAFA